MVATKIYFLRNRLLTLAFFLFFGSLSVSKGLSSICEFTIIFLSMDKIVKVRFQDLKANKTAFIFGLFFLVLVLGLLWTTNLSQGLKVIRHHHRWLVIPFLFVLNIEIIQKFAKELLLTFVLTAALASLITICFSFMPENIVIKISNTVPLIQEYPHSANRTTFGLYSPFVDRLQFSNLIGLAGITLLFLVHKTYFNKVLLLALLPIVYCSIILGGRGGQLALFASLVVYGILLIRQFVYPKLANKVGKLIASLALVVVVLVPIVSTPLVMLHNDSTISKRYQQILWELDSFYSGNYKKYNYVHFTSIRRIVSWKHLTQTFLDNPILGVGTGDLNDELKVRYSKDPYIFPVNIHSQYLHILAGWGILGFLAFFGAWAWWLRHLYFNTNNFVYGVVFTVFSLTSMLSDAVLIKLVDLMAFIAIIAFFGPKDILSTDTINE